MPPRSEEASSSRQQHASTSTVFSSAPPRRALKVVLIGSAGIGKTALRDHWHTNRFNASYRATIGADFVTKQIDRPDPPPRTRRPKGGTISVAVWDTAGQERFRSLGRAFYRGADAVVLAYDVTRPETLYETRGWWADFKSANGFDDSLAYKRKGEAPHSQRSDDASALQDWLKTVTLVAVGCKADLLTNVAASSARGGDSTHEAQEWFDSMLRLDFEPRGNRAKHQAAEENVISEPAAAKVNDVTAPYKVSEERPPPNTAGKDRSAPSFASSDSGPTARPPLSTLGSDLGGSRPPSTGTLHAGPSGEAQQSSLEHDVSETQAEVGKPADAQLHARRSIASINLIHEATDPDPSRLAPNAENSRIIDAAEYTPGRAPNGGTSSRDAASSYQSAEAVPTQERNIAQAVSTPTSYGVTPPAVRPDDSSSAHAHTSKQARGRYDSTVSLASTMAGGASLYHTPRGSTLFSFNSNSSEEDRHRADAVARTPRLEASQNGELEDGERTPRVEGQVEAITGAGEFDVGALDRALHEARYDHAHSSRSDGDEQPDGESPEAPGYSQQVRPGELEGEPIPFPSTPSADRVADVRRAARSRKSSSNAATNSGARSRSRFHGDTTTAQPPALELPARPTTLYEAPPVPVGSGFLHRSHADSSGPAARGMSAHVDGIVLADGDSVRSESDYDAACEDDEEPAAPATGFVLHLTSAKTGQGVSGVFKDVVERVTQRWEVEEWEERQAQVSSGGAFGVDVDKKTREKNARGKGWWRFGRGQQNVDLTWEEREEIQVRRGIRIAAGKEPRSCCGT